MGQVNGSITTYGGVLIENGNVLFDFSNTAVEFETYGSFDVEIDVLTTDLLEQDEYSPPPYVYLRIFENDKVFEKTIRKKMKIDERTLHFNENSRVKILKLSEAYMGVCVLKDLMHKPIKSVEKEDKVKVEFIGHSLVSGFGNNGGLFESICDTDWTKTWCYHLCQKYNWEAIVHSYSCMGLVEDSSGKRENQIMERRRRIIGCRPETIFDYSTFKASIVILNIGTNDFGRRTVESIKDLFMQKAKELVEELRQQYGNEVIIIFVYGPIMGPKPREVIKEIPNMFTEEKKTVFAIESILDFEDNSLWGKGSHPTAKGHQEMANVVIPQIDEILSKFSLN